jgi:AcrR family transcriptional regulator
VDTETTTPPATVVDRILSGAVEAASVHGIGRMSMADVARRAGLSRATVYKHFGGKDELVAAAVQREATALGEAVVASVVGIADLREAMSQAVLVTLQLARGHPLLDRVVRTEPERLVPLLTTGDSQVLPLLRAPVEAVVRCRLAGLDEVGARRVADVLVRLLVSYALRAPDDPPEVVAAVVGALLTDGAAAVATVTDAASLAEPTAPARPTSGPTLAVAAPAAPTTDTTTAPPAPAVDAAGTTHAPDVEAP